MRQLCLPFYTPCCTAPERIALSLLGAALQVTDKTLREQYPCERPPVLATNLELLAMATARKIANRCVELRDLLDTYDAIVDELTGIQDDDIPF